MEPGKYIFEKYVLSEDLDEKRKQLNACYTVFAGNRQRKNYPISIDFESLFIEEWEIHPASNGEMTCPILKKLPD